MEATAEARAEARAEAVAGVKVPTRTILLGGLAAVWTAIMALAVAGLVGSVTYEKNINPAATTIHFRAICSVIVMWGLAITPAEARIRLFCQPFV